MSGAIALVGGAALGYIIILLRRLIKMASTAQDVLREVSETVASTSDLTAKVLELIQNGKQPDGSIVLTADQADSITTSLQGVQDSNSQTVAAINAVLTPPTA